MILNHPLESHSNLAKRFRNALFVQLAIKVRSSRDLDLFCKRENGSHALFFKLGDVSDCDLQAARIHGIPAQQVTSTTSIRLNANFLPNLDMTDMTVAKLVGTLGEMGVQLAGVICELQSVAGIGRSLSV